MVLERASFGSMSNSSCKGKLDVIWEEHGLTLKIEFPLSITR
jgi:hypothetical protein